MKLNENDFPNYLEVRELIESGNKETLLFYINVMYEKYNDLAKATKWMQPEYIEYLKKLDEHLSEKYFRELLGCKTIEEEQLTKLKLLRETKKQVIGSVIKRDLQKKIKSFVRNLREDI